MQKEPSVSVGILNANEIDINLLGKYSFSDEVVTGRQAFRMTTDGKISWQGKEYDSVSFTTNEKDACFEVDNVVIGVNFHWERRETQKFKGNLRVIVEDGKLTIINILLVEDYLMSVISSEMSATASEEFLKSHAIISRSWLLAQINKDASKEKFDSSVVTDDEIIRWYDHDDHTNYDVCADDHCQRYQGITRQTTDTVAKAVEATRGLVLTDKDGKFCDTRFSKCCGGVFEEFENCWEPVHHHYLEATRDGKNERDFPDLTNEENAREWIMTKPDAYCNTSDAAILSQVLNNYDQETTDFYRWKIRYSQEELSALIKERTGIDFGKVIALEPVERGTSARLTKLRIVGTKKTMTIGKELEIRRSLSKSHLYSSAFVVETENDGKSDVPTAFTLHGAGWGHGVGLCQIGAAVMGARGCDYRTILMHYFPGAQFTKLY